MPWPLLAETRDMSHDRKELEMTVTPDDLVRREVYYCVSTLVSTLTQGNTTESYRIPAMRDHVLLVEQAQELCNPIDDWEEAGTQEGWTFSDGLFWLEGDSTLSGCGELNGTPDWQGLCSEHDIEPYQREIFEHWIVSDWLADRLAEKGEKVDKDFAGLTVWGRTTTGQGIASDSVIISITEEMNK